MGHVFRWAPLLLLSVVVSACAVTPETGGDSEFGAGRPIVTMSASCADGTTLEEYASGTLSPPILGTDVRWELYIPGDWETRFFGLLNGGRRLVVFHQGTIDPYLLPNPALPQEGFDVYNEVVCNLIASDIAVAWTSNTENGYDIEGAYLSAEPLLDAVRSTLRYDPDWYYQVGFSQGGLLGPMFAEAANPIFDGALSICGPVDGFTPQLQYLGDVRVLFDYFVQDNYANYDSTNPESAIIPTTDPTAPAFAVPDDPGLLPWDATYATHPDGTLDFSSTTYGTAGQSLPADIEAALRARYADALEMASVDQIELPSYTPEILAYAAMQPLYYAVRGVNQVLVKTGGQPYANPGTYTGSNDDSALNDKVIRYTSSADSAALSYVRDWYDTTGSLQTKLVTLHTTEDPAVPYWHEVEYAEKVALAVASHNLRQQFADRIGHCVFPQEELVAALDGMIRWVEFGTEPPTGNVTTTIDDPPSVTVHEPTVTPDETGSTVSASATATDDVGVTMVEFVLTNDGHTVDEVIIDTNSLDGWSADWVGIADGSYEITAKAVDTKSQPSLQDEVQVTVGSVTSNSPPTASFTYACTDLSCSFDGSASSDPDGDVLGYAWSFGDGATATGVTADHSYGGGGTYTVTLTVSDSSASDSQSQSVTVGIKLTATGRKVQGKQVVDLAWDGAISSWVDVYRDGTLVAITDNDGAYTHDSGVRGGGSFVYQVCEAGTSTCSNEATVTF